MTGITSRPRPLLVPKALRPHDVVAVVAPSSPFDRDDASRALDWLRTHFEVKFDPRIFEREGFLAGSDERRRAELNAALADPNITAIIAARGGHGLLRILDQLEFFHLRSSPKWLVGFSDPTLLHLGASREQVASLHAPNLVGLARSSESARREWLDALLAPTRPRTYTGAGWVEGDCRAPLVGGNLTLLVHAAAAGQLELPHRCILALEDVAESSYRIDRMLTALRLSTPFSHVRGLALGQFTGCSPGAFGVETTSVLEAFANTCGLPTVAELPFGHDAGKNRPLVLGMDGYLNGHEGTLTFALRTHE